MLLAPAWIVDLTSLVSNDIVATDASTSYGLGVSHARVDNATAEAVMSFDDKRGDYITIALGLEEPTPKDRKSIPRELPLDKYDFADVLMIPWPHDERPEVVELRALLSGVKWLLRSAKRIGQRQIFLIGSRVVLGAARKGRSSSPQLAYLMRKLSALLMFSGTITHCLYIPTEFNPADGPSRGHKRKHRKSPSSTLKRSARAVRKTSFSKL